MINKFQTKSILDTLAWIAVINNVWRIHVGIPQIFSSDAFEARVAEIRRFIDALRDAGLIIAAENAENLLAALEEGVVRGNGDRIISGMCLEKALYYGDKVANFLGDEAGSKVFLVVSHDAASLYGSLSPLFGAEVAAKFPSIAYDIEEAGKCLALERSTASAFHSLRCLEAAIRAISRSLSIEDPTKGSQRNWSFALAGIQKEMDARWPKGHRISGDAVIFERFHAIITATQNPFRNSTMHLESKYTEAEARHLFEMVKGLMQRVAARIDEDGMPRAE